MSHISDDKLDNSVVNNTTLQLTTAIPVSTKEVDLSKVKTVQDAIAVLKSVYGNIRVTVKADDTTVQHLWKDEVPPNRACDDCGDCNGDCNTGIDPVR